MKLKIKPLNDEIKEMYKEHGHFHDGDSGLDLFIRKIKWLRQRRPN